MWVKYRGISKIPNTVSPNTVPPNTVTPNTVTPNTVPPNTVSPNRRFNFFGHIHKFKVRTLKECRFRELSSRQQLKY